MSWTTSTSDLRRLLSDGPTDRYRFRKRVFGELNGTNRTFKTFEFRRITDFTTASAPLGVYKNGTLLSAVSISTDYPSSGEFVLASAPVDGDLVEASYYIQWFLDSELDDFLSKSASWLGFGSDATTVPVGLQPAALKYAAAEAYLKMAMRWQEAQSDTFRVEDMPDADKTSVTDGYVKMADTFNKQAKELRDHFYTRQGQSLAPLFGSVQGRIRDTTPRG